VIGGLLVTTVAVRFGRAAGVRSALIASCALVIAYVHAPGLAGAVAIVFALGGTVAMVQSMLIATNQQYAPRENRGRILSWWQGLVGLAYGTGLWVHGRIGDSIGLRTSLTVGAVIVFVSGGAVSFLRPRWRHLVDADHLLNA
jgi:predicted MFS family arabinose efflux permease